MSEQEKKAPQFLLPRGLAGRVTFMFMNRGHKAIYENVAKVLDLQPEDDLLDVACGNGYFVRKYASKVHGIAGLDLSELAVKLATKKNKERVAVGTAEFIKGEASKLPWEDGKFSAVSVMAGLPAFPKPLGSLEEIHRVLRPRGRLVASIEWNAQDGKDHSKEVEKYGYQIWSEADVRDLFKDAGFTDISITYAKGLMMPKMMIACGVKQ